jgi:Bacterial capsule synthesis protein PGA_cap
VPDGVEGEREGMPNRVPEDGPRRTPVPHDPRIARRLVLVAVVLPLVGVGAWVVIADDASPTADGARAGSSTTAAPSDPTAASEAAAAPPTTPARDPVLGNGQTVTIAFGGDTNFDGSNAARVASDPSSILAGAAPVLSGADLAVVNMETAIGVGGTPAPKEFTFQAPPPHWRRTARPGSMSYRRPTTTAWTTASNP